MACQTFFFFFQEKQATETGILQIYKHGEKGRNALQTARLWEECHGAPSSAGRVLFLSDRFGFLLPPLPEAPPGSCLSQIGQCTKGPAQHHRPSQHDDLAH